MATAGNAAGPLPILIETKLWPPLVRAGTLPRARLVNALRERIEAHAVTLVSASAGFGKTSLLAAWYASSATPETIAWVNLDRADNDPTRFWAHIVESLRRTLPPPKPAHPAAPVPPTPTASVATLVNELAAVRARRVLVLDDLHQVSNPVCHAGLDALVRAMPPETRLVVGSRTDPAISLARLRAAGSLAELRASDLAYTKREGREVAALRPLAGVGARDAERLRRRTEGWPAGMYLALLAAERRADPSGFVEEFAGDIDTIADYLKSEVLAPLDDETQDFLIRTSVLDELQGPLCDAVLDVTGSVDRLRSLEASNAFLVPLDDRRRLFRYHQLFRDRLLLEFRALDRDVRTTTHRRASTWYGSVGGRPALAIEHALAAEDWGRAATLVMDTATDAAQKGRWFTVLGWISALPREELIGRPLLPILAASLATALGSPGRDVERWLDHCRESRHRYPERWTTEYDAVAMYPEVELAGNDVGACVSAAEQLVMIQQRNRQGTAITRGVLAWMLYLAGDAEQASTEARLALDARQATTWVVGTLQANAVLALLAVERGDGQAALRSSEAAVAAAAELELQGQVPAAARARIAHALALAECGKLDAAEQEASQVVSVREGTAADASHAHALIGLASIYRRKGYLQRAQETLETTEAMVRSFPDPGRLGGLLAAERKLLAAARGVVNTVEPLTGAEVSVLRLLPSRMSQREIAATLYLSPNTIKSHCRAIYRKFDVGSRVEAVARARAVGLVEPGGPAAAGVQRSH